jgi:dipeptidyl aminopeptidase/acylaminoacyl peptidase
VPLTPSVVRRQAVIGSSAVSPDGARVAYTRRTVEANRYRTNLWVVGCGGGRPRPITHGRWNDTAPAWSPDGTALAFVSDRGKGEALHVIRPDGGEAERICVAPSGAVSEPVWSPDGTMIAFVGGAAEARFWAGDPQERRARVIRTVDWRDDSGRRDHRSHLFVVAARAGARPRQVTRGEFDVAQPCWHPGGRRLAFASSLEPDADLFPARRIYEVPARGGRPRPLAQLGGRAHMPAWSPDGRRLAFLGTDIPGAPDHAEDFVWVLERGGVHCLTGELDLPATIGWGSDLHDYLHGAAPAPRWDGDTLVVAINRRGCDEVWRVALDGAAVPLTTGATTVSSLSAGGGRIVVTATADPSPPEVCVVEPGRLRPLTRHGGAWLRRSPAPSVREVDAGGVPAFLFEPAGANGRGPLVLAPHGGPYGAHAPTPELDSWVLTSHGYRVLAPNIRGSCGYGRAWIEPISGAWGGPDADDLLTAVTWAVRRRIADPARIAVMGLSYGGWAANWLAGAAPGRFCCVISENGVASLTAAHAVSCIGPGYDRAIGYGPVGEHGDAMWAASPLRNAGRITAPVLMLQGEADRICPLDDTWQLFVALRERGHDVELVLYPEEHHVMMATARPDRRVDRLERILAFLARHCPA